MIVVDNGLILVIFDEYGEEYFCVFECEVVVCVFVLDDVVVLGGGVILVVEMWEFFVE